MKITMPWRHGGKFKSRQTGMEGRAGTQAGEQIMNKTIRTAKIELDIRKEPTATKMKESNNEKPVKNNSK